MTGGQRREDGRHDPSGSSGNSFPGRKVLTVPAGAVVALLLGIGAKKAVLRPGGKESGKALLYEVLDLLLERVDI